MKHYSILLISLVATLPLILNAAIVLDSTATFTTNTDPNQIVKGTWTFDNAADLGGFDPTSSDKLVMAFGGENFSNLSVTYGGTALNPIEFGNGARYVGIYYLDAPTSNGNLVITNSDGNGIGGTLFALSGTASGFGSSNLSAGGSTTLTATAGSFLVAAAVRNQGTPPTANSPLTQVFSSGSGSSATGVAYQEIVSSGSVTPSFNNSVEFVSGVEFTAAVPEPSAFALLATCFGITFFMLRRR